MLREEREILAKGSATTETTFKAGQIINVTLTQEDADELNRQGFFFRIIPQCEILTAAIELETDRDRQIWHQGHQQGWNDCLHQWQQHEKLHTTDPTKLNGK